MHILACPTHTLTHTQTHTHTRKHFHFLHVKMHYPDSGSTATPVHLYCLCKPVGPVHVMFVMLENQSDLPVFFPAGDIESQSLTLITECHVRSQVDIWKEILRLEHSRLLIDTHRSLFNHLTGPAHPVNTK